MAAVAVALWTSLDTERKRLDDKYASVFAWFERAPGAKFGTLYIKNTTEYPVYKWEVTATWIDPASSEKISEKLGSRELGLLPPSKDPHQFDIHERPIEPCPKTMPTSALTWSSKTLWEDRTKISLLGSGSRRFHVEFYAEPGNHNPPLHWARR